MEIKICIEGNPIPKKNGQQIVKRRFYKNGKLIEAPCIVQSDRYRAYEHLGILQARCQYHEKKPIDQPVNVKMLFYRKTRHNVDLLNLGEATQDILVRAGVLLDDNYHIVAATDGSRVYVGCPDPRVEITITDFKE